jgi:hypothetical protein
VFYIDHEEGALQFTLSGHGFIDEQTGSTWNVLDEASPGPVPQQRQTYRWIMRALVIALVLLVAGCAADDAGDDAAGAGTPAQPSAEQRYPDIVDVDVERDGDTFNFSVTVSSPYDTPERYADGWRVIGPDGTAYGEHTLAHHHADEQPFTRTQRGVEIPEEVDQVIVEGRDSENGYGGGTVTVPLPD